MTATSPGLRRRLTPPFPTTADAGNQLPEHLHGMARSLNSLEEEVRAAQTLLSQLTAGLDQVLDTLGDYRRALSTLAPAQFSPPGASPNVNPASGPHLRIYCFGTFELYRGERPVPVQAMGKGSLILKYLAATMGRPVQREILLEMLWPDAHPAVANNRLRGVIHRMRRAFAEPDCETDCLDCVRFDNGSYSFDPAISLWTDVLAFEQCWRAATRLEADGRIAEAMAWYADAERLYRGDFLQDDRFEEWTLLRREELLGRYLALLDKLGSYWFKSGAVDQAVDSWTKVLNKDPWREDTYRALMLALAQAGNRGAALHWYDVCTGVLHDQLHIEPEPETQELFQRIRAGL